MHLGSPGGDKVAGKPAAGSAGAGAGAVATGAAGGRASYRDGDGDLERDRDRDVDRDFECRFLRGLVSSSLKPIADILSANIFYTHHTFEIMTSAHVVSPRMTSFGSPKVLVSCATFNALAHPYTKFNSAHHGHSETAVETATQQTRRYELNARALAEFYADVLLLQEHDQAFVVPGYRRIMRAFVDGRSEGCSIALADSSPMEFLSAATVDLGEGKSAVIAKIAADAACFWAVSLHLKGGRDTDDVKRSQVQRVQTTLQALGFAKDTDTLVFAGDMNDVDPDRTFGALLRTGCNVCWHAPVGPTGLTSAFDKAIAIDHVFVTCDRRVEIQPLRHAPGSPWATDAVVGSDHVPVLFTVIV